MEQIKPIELAPKEQEHEEQSQQNKPEETDQIWECGRVGLSLELPTGYKIQAHGMNINDLETILNLGIQTADILEPKKENGNPLTG